MPLRFKRSAGMIVDPRRGDSRSPLFRLATVNLCEEGVASQRGPAEVVFAH